MKAKLRDNLHRDGLQRQNWEFIKINESGISFLGRFYT